MEARAVLEGQVDRCTKADRQPVCSTTECGSSNIDQNSVCLTPECVKAASTVIQNMDESVNPCDDFYRFACGRYIQDASIPEDQTEINNFITSAVVLKTQLRSIFEESIKEEELKPFVLVKTLYKICMNTTALEADGLSTIKKIIKEVGGWPVLEGADWNEDSFDWKKSTYTFRKYGLSIDNFINFAFAHDAKNSSKLTITLDQPQLDVAKVNMMEGFKDELVKTYYEYMVDLAVLFGADKEFATSDVRNMTNFKSELAKITLSDEERLNVDALYNPMTIAEIQNKYRSIPWLELINNVINSPNVKILDTEVINVMVPDYLHGLEKLLQESSKRDQANYAFFQTVRSLIDYLPEHIRDREQQFRAVYSGVSQKPPRWRECVYKVSQHLQLAASALYVRKHFHDESKEAVSEMVSDVRNEFVKIIKKLKWMDDETRKIAIDKALAMTIHIGYPVEFLNNKTLEKYYSKLNLTSNNYFDVVNQISLFETDAVLSEVCNPVNKTDWRTRTSTIDINAGYVPPENSIQVPAAILQSVFYNKDRPHYMNYGAIGYVIGHEITHGFDDQGKKYNKMGDLENWWAEKTDTAYAEKAKCFVKQYGDYIVPEVGEHLNGETTQGENIADNGGIKEAYLGYNSWVERNGPELTLPGLNYTAKQLFWISAANCFCSKERKKSLAYDILTDEHSPARYRINVPFGNTDYFAKDFNCPDGSKMIPKQKCQIW
ncbi:hypothetical protein ILUMI_05943 [Ignelater luminosus]|uniref:Neprilysin n=1 Tax=Ignelater luminosus TaxID=2038154 RepID=A0A8K0DBB7_IGNLU|nr:hypothetical protein ILUMI_05943 [Ignelater luminosus]